nr:sigma-70 family RNA polymerase sigma factor [Sandaracinus sp.]
MVGLLIMPGHDDGETLALRASNGDRDAERELCRRLGPAVRAFARRRLRSRAAVDDFAHDVMIEFIEALRAGRVADHSRVGGFALGICRNLARSGNRKMERRQEALERLFAPPEPTPPWDPIVLSRSRLEECVALLTDRARHILRATFTEESSDDEIAVGLSISQTNVRVIRHRSLAALRECMERPLTLERR